MTSRNIFNNSLKFNEAARREMKVSWLKHEDAALKSTRQEKSSSQGCLISWLLMYRNEELGGSRFTNKREELHLKRGETSYLDRMIARHGNLSPHGGQKSAEQPAHFPEGAHFRVSSRLCFPSATVATAEPPS